MSVADARYFAEAARQTLAQRRADEAVKAAAAPKRPLHHAGRKDSRPIYR